MHHGNCLMFWGSSSPSHLSGRRATHASPVPKNRSQVPCPRDPCWSLTKRSKSLCTNWAVATTKLLIKLPWFTMVGSGCLIVNRDPYNGSFWPLQFQFNCVTVVFHLYRTKSPRCTDPWEDSCSMKSWLLGWVMSLHSPQNWKVTLFQETSSWSPNNNRTSPLQSRISWSKGHLRLFGRVSFTQIQPHNSALWPVSINSTNG